jgi:streptogramin lyase
MLPSGVDPVSIARSGSGKLWFTATGSAGQGIVGSISTAGAIKTYLTPTAASGPFAICAGPDGNMWFTEKSASAIGVITPAGTVTEYPTITPNAAPAGISKGSDGALWFAESGGQRMGRISTSGFVTEFTGPTQPMFTTLGKDGNVWFGDMATHSIGRIKPSGAVAEYSISSTSQPSGVASNGGSVWYVDQSAVALQYISPPTLAFSGTFLIPGASPSPQLLAFGGDGNIWITEPGSNSIGVYDLHPQSVTPSSIDFTAAGQTQSFSISENNYSGEFTVSGCSSLIATVAPTGPATSFTATAVAAGTCTLTVSDTMNNSTLVSVTVTTTNFEIQ